MGEEMEDVASRASGEGGAPACRARCERRERGEGTTAPLVTRE